MDFVFADDSRQKKPSRKNTGPLIAIGGVYVPSDAVGPLEKAIENLCAEVGFPKKEQFKWSPSKKETFMRTKLVDKKRLAFYDKLFFVTKQSSASAFIVIEDTSRKPANKITHSHEQDITALFLERANWCFHKSHRDGLVIVATPGGGTTEKDKFLTHSLELSKTGTRFSSLGRLPLGVVSVNSSQMRLLQLADIVVSCTTARVAGDSDYSPAVFEMIKPMLRQDMGRVGGIGLKLHPDFVFANLYHWLVGDTDFFKGNTGRPLPIDHLPFSKDAGEAAYDFS